MTRIDCYKWRWIKSFTLGFIYSKIWSLIGFYLWSLSIILNWRRGREISMWYIFIGSLVSTIALITLTRVQTRVFLESLNALEVFAWDILKARFWSFLIRTKILITSLKALTWVLINCIETMKIVTLGIFNARFRYNIIMISFHILF